jgi:kynurenine formamidase
MGRSYVDLAHVVADGQVTYPGLPAPVISDHLSREASRAHYAPGTEFHIGRIDMVTNTGTYLDTPAHRYADGWGLDALPLEAVADLPGDVIDAQGPAIGADTVAGRELAGHAVLFRTGWSRHFGTEAYGAPGHPFLTEEAARVLLQARVALVGIDSVNIDDTGETSGGRRPVHSGLLAAGVPIVEHLTNLGALTGPFRFFAVPVRVRGLGTFPVRAFAITEA